MTELDPRLTQPSLLVRIRDPRDAESWRAFLEMYAPLIYRYCRRQGLQDADAADIGQEVLSQVAHSIRAFEYQPERGRFRDWLGTVTRSKVARFRENQGRWVRVAGGGNSALGIEEAVRDDGEALWTAEFNSRVLEVALERIRPSFEETTWRAFEQTWIANLPAAEAARALGIPIDTVYVAKSRVLKRLRLEVIELAEDDPALVALG